MSGKVMKSGIILLNKHAGISSNMAVNMVKKLLQVEKAGHLGTLDVQAKGLLCITLNKATKIFDYFLKKDKSYSAVFKFGIETPSLDLETEVNKQEDVDISYEDVKLATQDMIGKQMQMPPVYSAKKIGGKTAYSLARRGEDVPLLPKEIEIYDFTCTQQLDKNTFKFEISCSSGTYIRCLARDLAKRLDTCGIMIDLVRTRCGDFYLADSYTIEDIQQGNYSILPLIDIFNMSKTYVTYEVYNKLKNGVITSSQCVGLSNGDKTLLVYCDEFLGLVEDKNGILNFIIKVM